MRAGEMVKCVKTPVAKADNLSSISRSHIEKRTDSQNFSSVMVSRQVGGQIHTQCNKKNLKDKMLLYTK